MMLPCYSPNVNLIGQSLTCKIIDWNYLDSLGTEFMDSFGTSMTPNFEHVFHSESKSGTKQAQQAHKFKYFSLYKYLKEYFGQMNNFAHKKSLKMYVKFRLLKKHILMQVHYTLTGVNILAKTLNSLKLTHWIRVSIFPVFMDWMNFSLIFTK